MVRTLILPIISALLVVIGAFLLKRGWWPRRVGKTPHCPKCDYILSGDQPRCPECGTEVASGNVVRGERRRRLLMAGTGGVMVLLGGWLLMAFATGLLVNNFDWKHHEPLSWLLKRVTNISTPAWAEVQRRLDNNLLSDSDQSAVVERGLEVQNMRSTNLLDANILDYIGRRYVDNKLSPSQADRFFANLLKVNLSVRPVVGTHSPVAYSVTNVGRGPTKDWWYRLRTLESQIDDGPAVTNVVRTTSGGSGFGVSLESSPGTNSTLAPVAKPGKHRLRVKVEMTTGTSGGVSGANWDEKAAVAKRVTQDVFADFEVIEGDTPVATVAAPDAAALRSMLTPKLTYNPDNRPPLNFIVFSAATLPIDVAVDVSVRLNGQEYPMGGVVLHMGRGGGDFSSTGTTHYPGELPSNADVILRGSEAVARETFDIKRIWKGEIVLQGIPIDRTH